MRCAGTTAHDALASKVAAISQRLKRAEWYATRSGSGAQDAYSARSESGEMSANAASCDTRAAIASVALEHWPFAPALRTLPRRNSVAAEQRVALLWFGTADQSKPSSSVEPGAEERR